MKTGIIGLPQVGKTSLFRILTKAHLSEHAFANPLSTPGELDLTAHVDFQALVRAIEAMGAVGYGPVEQADFLLNLGIERRAAKLRANANREAAADVNAALGRLLGTGHTEMGMLFKVAAFAHKSVGRPPAF